jgi:8-oxo-dGTP pyrophosphatase MutT (NUDIX family)
MYEVFFESGRIVFTHNRHFYAGKTIVADREQDLWDVFVRWTEAFHAEDLIFVSDHPASTFRRFSTMFELIEAAGGMVFHPGEEYLFIYRRGKWDLPKGKIDDGETPGQAAIREVEEECGIAGLKIMEPLPSGFHVYVCGEGQWMLKKTNWYLMQVPEACKLYPQQSEGIEEARWFRPGDFPQIMSNTYPFIKKMISRLGREGKIKGLVIPRV